MFQDPTSDKSGTALLSGFAYFVSAYKEPESIVRLVNVLAKGPDQFYIHFDNKIGGQRFKRWKTLIEKECQAENIQISSKFQCRWGSFGVVDATLRAMNYFEDLNYDYFINLTGECYPIKSLRQIQEAFKDQNAGFMTFWKIPYEDWYQGGMNRIHNRFFFLPKKGYPYVRIFHIPRFRKRLPRNLKAYGGWSLFCLPKDLVSYVVKFAENNPDVKSFFKHAFAPSELIFQTILLNSPFRDRIVNDNKRYVNFEGAHPRILTKDDYPILKESEKLFARKFNPAVDKEILDIIDREIMGIKRDTRKRAPTIEF
jgi:hypothetical protein